MCGCGKRFLIKPTSVNVQNPKKTFRFLFSPFFSTGRHFVIHLLFFVLSVTIFQIGVFSSRIDHRFYNPNCIFLTLEKIVLFFWGGLVFVVFSFFVFLVLFFRSVQKFFLQMSSFEKFSKTIFGNHFQIELQTQVSYFIKKKTNEFIVGKENRNCEREMTIIEDFY